MAKGKINLSIHACMYIRNSECLHVNVSNSFVCGKKEVRWRKKGRPLNVFLKLFFWAMWMDGVTYLQNSIKKLGWCHTVEVILQLTFSNLVYVFETFLCSHDLDLSINYAVLNCGILQLEVLWRSPSSLLSYYKKEKWRCRNDKWLTQADPAGQCQNWGWP